MRGGGALKTDGVFRKNFYFCAMSKRDSDILFFVAFCLEAYKNKHGLTGEAASSLFDRHGIKQYLSDHYDVLHTQGMPWILEEIEERVAL